MAVLLQKPTRLMYILPQEWHNDPDRYQRLWPDFYSAVLSAANAIDDVELASMTQRPPETRPAVRPC